MKTRIETDTMGSIDVPATALYGAQTQRALENFTISTTPMPHRFIHALLLIKSSSAAANRDLKLLAPPLARAIMEAIAYLLKQEISRHFPVPILQTGSGTSTNMNANEVISNLVRKQGLECSPNDHVNLGQSSNDVIPTAMHVSAALVVVNELEPALAELADSIRAKAEQYRHVVKTGRTHLMDALPIRLHRELEGWASQLDDNINRLQSVLNRLQTVPLGGTAVGSGVNCHPLFAEHALRYLSNDTGLRFTTMDSCYKGLSSIDTVAEASGILKTCAVTLMKIANDLRWMNSGPDAGLGDISLPALQPGSSIMPDKVNPVIPEAVCMAAAQVIGNDTAITIAAQAGNFQLNTMLPLAAATLLGSIELIASASRSLGKKAIQGMVVKELRMREPLTKNPILVTALTPYIGYLQAAAIAKAARQQQRSIYEVACEMTALEPTLLARLLDPEYLADGSSSGSGS